VSPFGIENLPADVVKALQALPQVVDRLDEVASATSEMAAMRKGIDSLNEDTGVLSEINEDVRRIAANLEHLPDIQTSVKNVNEKIGVVAGATEALPAMDKRMATIEDAMPTLVEVQQHLSKLPETIDTLGASIDRMATLMDRLLTSIDRLDGNVESLQSSIEPLSRVADKLPGSSPKK
jgi:uncharacterized protein YoxC